MFFSQTFIFLTALLAGPDTGDVISKPAPTLSASAVVDKVQSFYENTTQFRAQFRQTVTNATFGRTTTSNGVVYLKKPGKMRWDYRSKRTKKVNKMFISDGKQLWAVFKDDKQLFKKNLQKDVLPVAVSFLTGTGDLNKEFNAKLDKSRKYGKKSDIVLKLTPKKPSASYKMLWLVVDPTNYRVKQSIVLNSKGDTNQFRFFKPNTKKPIPDKFFVFNQKAFKDYRLVDPTAP